MIEPGDWELSSRKSPKERVTLVAVILVGSDLSWKLPWLELPWRLLYELRVTLVGVIQVVNYLGRSYSSWELS